MGEKKQSKNHKISLKFGLVTIIIVCWLLPILLMLISMTIYIDNDVKKNLDYNSRMSVQNASKMTSRSVSLAINASKTASYDRTVRLAYQRYLETGDSSELYEDVNGFLMRQYAYDERILTTVLFFVNNPEILYHSRNRTAPTTYMNVLEYRNNIHDEIIEKAKNLDTGMGFLKSGNHIYMYRNIVNSNFKPYAIIVMQLNPSGIFSGFDGIHLNKKATVYINEEPMFYLPENDKNPIFLESLGLRHSYDKPEVIEIKEEAFVTGGAKLDAVKISYIVEIDRQSYIDEMFGFVNMMGFFVLILFPLIGLAFWFFYRQIFSPISQIVKAAEIIEDGNLGYQLNEFAGNKEFDYLTETFNKMSVRLKKQFDKIYSEEVTLRDARIMALQSQINPHFLNNTLEIINWEARLNGNQKVSRMIESLSIMLDAAMDRKSAPVIPLHQEMIYVDAYLYIISERFLKRLEVEKQLDESLMTYEVPRLILQPIIENAVEHGVAVHQKGKIILKTEKIENNLVLSIDNDSPMRKEDEISVKKLLNPEHDAKKEGSIQLGIYNVNLRLKMIYGKEAGLSINSVNGHTIATIKIPLSE